jgi:hypothetical protein
MCTFQCPHILEKNKVKYMIKINIKNLNFFTILSIITLLAGIIFYIYWGIRFGVWTDIGIYSITIVFVLGGIFGILLTLYEQFESQ